MFLHLSVILSTGGGGHAWLHGGVHGHSGWGGMHGCSRGACVVAPGGVHGCSGGGGHAWFLPGGMPGFFRGGGQGGMRRIRRDTVNERAVRILLECILVCQCTRINKYYTVNGQLHPRKKIV